MSTARAASAPGTTRTCPHCRTTILDSATVCPSCKHHLRFGAGGVKLASSGTTAFAVEGMIRHPPDGGAWEYAMLLSIKNEKGEEIARQLVGVGALQANEQRTFSLAVEVFKPGTIR